MAHRARTEPRPTTGIALGGIAAVVATVLLVPLRDHIDNANLALVLVLVVVLAAIAGGRSAGASAAIVGTIGFDFFLVPPYNSMRIESADDIETVLLLLALGLLVGEIAARARRARRRGADAADTITRLRRVAEKVATGAPVDEVARLVANELTELLGLWSCQLELPPFTWSLPRLAPTGTVELTEHHWSHGAFALPVDGVELPVLARGQEVARFVLVGDPARPISVEDREAAVVLADQLGSAIAIAGPGNLRAVAEE